MVGPIVNIDVPYVDAAASFYGETLGLRTGRSAFPPRARVRDTNGRRRASHSDGWRNMPIRSVTDFV